MKSYCLNQVNQSFAMASACCVCARPSVALLLALLVVSFIAAIILDLTNRSIFETQNQRQNCACAPVFHIDAHVSQMPICQSQMSVWVDIPHFKFFRVPAKIKFLQPSAHCLLGLNFGAAI